MNSNINIDDVKIRTELKPGDIGYITFMHGAIYKEEYNYGIEFETYVALGLCEFFKDYDPEKERVWLCEHNGKIVGSLLLKSRGEEAQLRYFLIEHDYRGIGLGSKLIRLYMDFLKECGYKSSYLWTTSELTGAASLYRKAGFRLTEEKQSTGFGKEVVEQEYRYR